MYKFLFMTRQNTFVVITIYSSKSANFWPHSRQRKPKQFLDLLGTGKSLLELSYERSKGICPEENIYFLVPQEYVHLVKEKFPQVTDDQILKEPVRRNSAPSLAYASYKIKKKNPDAVIVVSPADHAVFGDIAYVRDIRKAVEIASSDFENLVIIGIKPHRPETSYGYIQYHHDSNAALKRIKTFTKKPQEDLAQLFLESGDFAWNTKIYVWHVDAITSAFQHFTPDVHESFLEGEEFYYTEQEEAFVHKAYTHCYNVSITNNIMEKTDKVLLLLGEFGWSDLGSWELLYDVKQKQADGNILEANAHLKNTQNCYIKSVDKKLIVVEGLKDFIVIDSADALLIYPKDQSAHVRNLISKIKEMKSDKYL